MAGSYNHIVLVGRLTRDPEIRYVQSGTAVTSFSLAVNRRTKQGEEAMFVDIVAWDGPGRKLAEICNTYLKKGMSVLIDGRLSIRSYETKDGEKRKVTEVVANDMQMLDSRGARPMNGDGDRFGDRSGTPAYATSRAASGESGNFESEDDEVPF
jgi:single-strand DNA-binding protein